MSAVKNRCENIGRKFFFFFLHSFVLLLRWRDTWQNAWRYLCGRLTKLKRGKLKNNGGRKRKREALDETRLTVFDLKERGIGKTRRGWTNQNRIVDNPMRTQPCTFCHFLNLSPCLTHGNKQLSSCIIASTWKCICQSDRAGGGAAAGRAEGRLGDENLTGKKGMV